ncbi:DUF1987 domain-containing protein [Roseibium denhamense]|uniref:SiaC family regulatory phosphoprotein domain-containing protein n=1 Tax=Roseibium denhamense TaxID=76305 RepID=A0ABY1NW28_9HYPH|nr:DUF1987 domain-containing protein [Roseibium denhamense]MTI04811.1 DUF1987 domain-containing protein [Roseibium denhamense]SMP19121.1 protein of unknown function [Roseibium denhamense]
MTYDAPYTVEATPRSPEIHLDPTSRTLGISGESYPEDASAFYGPVFQEVKGFLNARKGELFTANIRFVYFNSSSAKAIMNLFQMLEEAAEGGHSIVINWYYDPDDDMMEEMGEDFAEDFEHATFNLTPEGTVA